MFNCLYLFHHRSSMSDNPHLRGPGAVTRSDARLLGILTVADLILTSGKTLFGHDKKILSLPQIQEGQLLVTGDRMGTKYW